MTSSDWGSARRVHDEGTEHRRVRDDKGDGPSDIRVVKTGASASVATGRAYGPAVKTLLRAAPSQLATRGYFAKMATARLNALSIACSGPIPSFMTSYSAMLNAWSALNWATAGL